MSESKEPLVRTALDAPRQAYAFVVERVDMGPTTYAERVHLKEIEVINIVEVKCLCLE